MFKRSVLMMIAVIALALTATVPAFAADNAPTVNHEGEGCKYAGEPYSEGSYVMQAGKLMRCVDGKWIEYDRFSASTGSNTAATASISSTAADVYQPSANYSAPATTPPVWNYSGTTKSSYSR